MTLNGSWVFKLKNNHELETSSRTITLSKVGSSDHSQAPALVYQVGFGCAGFDGGGQFVLFLSLAEV